MGRRASRARAHELGEIGHAVGDRASAVGGGASRERRADFVNGVEQVHLSREAREAGKPVTALGADEVAGKPIKWLVSQ